MFFKSFTFFRGSPLFASAALVATGLAAGSASATAIKVLNSNFASPVEPSTGTTWSTVGTPTSPGSDTAIADWGVSAPTAGNVATGVQNYSPSIGQVCYGNGNGESTYNVYQDVGILQANRVCPFLSGSENMA